MESLSHKQRLLNYLDKHESITSLESIKELGNTRLAATICILRKEGHYISSTPVQVTNRYGKTVTVTKYKKHKTIKDLVKQTSLNFEEKELNS